MKTILNLIICTCLIFSSYIKADELYKETFSVNSSQLESHEDIGQPPNNDLINSQIENDLEKEPPNKIEIDTDTKDTSNKENSASQSTVNKPDLDNALLKTNPTQVIFTGEESTYLVVALIFIILLLPFIPGYILKRKIKSGAEIVFAHVSEMRAYQVSGFLLILSMIMWINVLSINLKNISGAIGLISILLLLGLFGFQKVISKNLTSASITYFLKIFFVAFGTLIVFLGTAISLIAFRSATENLNKRKYGDAAVNATIVAGAAASTAAFSSSYFGESSQYINGPNNEDFAGAFPDKGIIDVFKIGVRVLIVSMFLGDEKIYLQKVLKHYRDTGKSLF